MSSSAIAVTESGRPLRVAVTARSVYPLHRYGGLERHVYDLVRCLLGRGAHITLITPPPQSDRPSDPLADAVFHHPQLKMRAVPYQTFPFANRRGTTVIDRSTAYPLFGWRAGRVAARLSAQGAIDIVHGLGASVLGYAVRNTSERRVPLILNPQGLEEFGATDPGRAPLKRIGYFPLRLGVRMCARAADRVLATDRALVRPVRQHLNVSEHKVRVVPNAIELRDCDNPDAVVRARSLREDAGMTAEGTLLLSVGRLEANKGFDVLIRALASLSADRVLADDWRWVLVGDGPMRRTLERDITAAGLAKHAILWGRAELADLHGWYEAATLFVHPTLYEGSSLVTLEAMAHRRAVVATRAGGLPDKVLDDVNGWLVAPGDAAALAAALAKALSDRAGLQRMGIESRAIVEREFSWTAVTDRLLDVYRELVP
jgi:glycosyltransferase involved in cell wall biosynthesis